MSWKDIIGRNRIASQDFEGRNDVVKWDVQKIHNEQLIKITFLSTNSKDRQGIRIAIDVGKGSIELLGKQFKDIELWADTAPKEVILKCKSEEGLISIYNIWSGKSGRNSLSYHSGMILEENNKKIVYHCNDHGINNKFDKLVFSIEKF
jgi:hypothetical protein